MKTILIKIGIGFLLSIGFLLLWMLGFGLSQAMFKVQFPSTNEDPVTTLALMYLISVLEVGALLFVHAGLQGSQKKRFLMIFSLLFGLQFVMSQVETLAFQSAVGITTLGIVQILAGGLLLSAGFSALLVVLDRNRQTTVSTNSSFQPSIGTVLLLLLVIYPMLYILAGYFIAWQFPAIRQYYTNSPSNSGFYAAFGAFFTDGLYFLQVGRAFLWLLIALPVLRNYRGTRLRAALMLGTTFSVVHCAQLLLPNPFMPASIRWPHLLETASSTFVWGFVLAYLCWRKKS